MLSYASALRALVVLVYCGTVEPTSAPIPSELLTTAGIIQTAVNARLERAEENGTIVVSRSPAIDKYVFEHMGELTHAREQLKTIEAAGSTWSDDASVMLAMLYSATAGERLWEQGASIAQYRTIIERSQSIQLQPWTDQQLRSGKLIASSLPNSSSSDMLADMFARILIGYRLAVDGPEAAATELNELEGKGRIPSRTITQLSIMIDLSRGHPRHDSIN